MNEVYYRHEGLITMIVVVYYLGGVMKWFVIGAAGLALVWVAARILSAKQEREYTVRNPQV